LSWKQTFCDAKFRRAAWMAIATRITDNTNGNAGVIFYSASLFRKAGTPVALGNIVTMSFFVLGTLLASCISGKFGRRPIQLWSLVVINLCLFLMGICVMLKWNNLLLGTMAIFFTFCQIGPCTIAWIYTSEIATKKSMSIAVTSTWIELLILGMITKPLFDSTDYGFFVFGTVNSVMMLIMFLFMKETKGLSEEQIGQLYVRDNQVKDMVELAYG